MSQDTTMIVDRILRDRRTVKVLAEAPLDVATDRGVIEELLAGAAWAPFHRPAAKVHQVETLPSILPWRFHMLDVLACRRLRELILGDGDTSKIPEMLAAATTLILATWLPNPNPLSENSGLAFEPTAENMEHIAAAAAAVQNLLLAATARGIPNYWSSGGALREPLTFQRLGIPKREILLGAVFLFPQGSDGPGVATGKLRGQRGKTSDWSRWVGLS